MGLRRNNDGVSEILGTALLIGIAILFFTILVTIVFSYPQSPAAPFVNIIGSINSDHDEIILEHFGGDFLDKETEIYVTINDQVFVVSVKSLFNQEETFQNWTVLNSNNDGVWNFGEIVTYSAQISIGSSVSISVVDDFSDQVVMTAVLQKVPTTENPSIITLQASDISATSANLRLYYDFVNYSGQLWFRYKSVADTTWILTAPFSSSGYGYYSHTLSELDGNTDYQFQAYMQYSSQQLQGDMKYFSTTSLLVSTKVDPILPYTQGSSPLTIAATNMTDIDNVSLYYRWSDGNWSGVAGSILGYDDFEIIASNWSYLNAIRSSTVSRSGSYSVEFIDSSDMNFLSDFQPYLSIQLSFWIYLDKVHPSDVVQVKFYDGTSEIIVQNYDNGLWQLNQWNFETLELKSTDYTFSTESYILIEMAVKNSHFIDDIYVNVTSTETVVDWTIFGIDMDGSDGWNWPFTFPNGNGFYEFFSIGYLDGSRESDPVQFDTKCVYGPGGP
jgi:hypothetical protein